jgi:hypothetical protein
VCESVVTEEARLSPGRSSDEDGPLTGPTVLGKRHTAHSASSLTHTCSCTRHHSSCYSSSWCMVDPRRSPVSLAQALRITRGHTPNTPHRRTPGCRPHGAGCWEAPHSAPSLTHTCSCTRHHSSCCMVDPRRPPVGITGSSTAARPSTPGHPPPHPLTRFHGRYPPRSARRPRMLFDSSSTAARPSTPGHPPPAPQALRYGTHHRRGGGQPSNQSKFAARTSTVNGWHELGPLLTINFSRCWYVHVGRLIDDLVYHHLGRAAAL